MMAKACHFYGWNYRDVENMPYRKFNNYYLAIAAIEAQASLIDIKINGFVNMKKTNQRSFWNQLNSKAYGIIDKGKRSLPNIYDVAEAFKRGISGQ